MNDQHIDIMLGIYAHLSMRQMAARIGRSIGTVQRLVTDLEKWGLVENPHPRQARAKKLTPIGIDKMHHMGYLHETVINTDQRKI
jgi:transposase